VTTQISLLAHNRGGFTPVLIYTTLNKKKFSLSVSYYRLRIPFTALNNAINCQNHHHFLSLSLGHYRLLAISRYVFLNSSPVWVSSGPVFCIHASLTPTFTNYILINMMADLIIDSSDTSSFRLRFRLLEHMYDMIHDI